MAAILVLLELLSLSPVVVTASDLTSGDVSESAFLLSATADAGGGAELQPGTEVVRIAAE